jgi:hypothetical protein
VTCRQSTPGPGHCSNLNRNQLLNSRRKGRQGSHPRVQTVQAGRGPGGCQWTHRRGLNMASPLSRPRYGISYPISTKSLILERNLQYSYIPTLHWYHVRHQSFCLQCQSLYPKLQCDIVPDIESKLWYRVSILNIVPDIEGFFSMLKQYRVYKEGLVGASSISFPI